MKTEKKRAKKKGRRSMDPAVAKRKRQRQRAWRKRNASMFKEGAMLDEAYRRAIQ